ncbi:MAG: ABC transporter ATP-binding protein [Saprospiraceae bacterium]
MAESISSAQSTDAEAKDQKPKVSREQLRDALGIFKYINPYKWSLIIGLLLLSVSSLVFMAFPYLIGEMVDTASGDGELGLTIQQLGLLLLVVLISQSVVSYFRVLLFAQVSERGIADVRKAVFARLLALPITFFEKNRSGELISRITADVEKLYSAFSITIAEFLRQVLILLFGITFIMIRVPKLSLIMLLTFPIVVVGAIFFGRYVRKLSKKRQEELAETNNVLSESIQSIQSVKAYVNEWLERKRYGKAQDRTVAVSLGYARARAAFSVFIITFLFGALFFVIYQAALMVQAKTLDAGDLLEFALYTAILGGAIAGLGNFYTELVGAIGATERIRDILREPTEPIDIASLEEGQRQVKAMSMEGNVSFQNINFSYPTRPDMQVMKGLSLDIKAGERVALVGPSGAGKSTIIQMLLRFYENYEGSILVDGKEIRSLDLAGYRSNLGIVPQEVLLFAGTIAENISYGKPDATRAEIEKAADEANALEFITRFPEGLETMVGERGVKLSGGQRQRIAIARALLKDPTILLLDEATSSLDAESERVVQEALDRLMEGRTSIVIAHRLATIRDVDRIFVIEDGQVAEAGTHDELSSLPDGLYNSLAKLQFENV